MCLFGRYELAVNYPSLPMLKTCAIRKGVARTTHVLPSVQLGDDLSVRQSLLNVISAPSDDAMFVGDYQ